VVNPLLLLAIGAFFTGWLLVLEFIFTLAMALRCYPLQPGGLLALQAIFIGLTDADTVRSEVLANFPVILLLIFMVAGIYFMREVLLFTFTKILLGMRSKVGLAVMFSFVSAFLSAFVDALTVTAVIISVAVGFYSVYHRVASGVAADDASGNHDPGQDGGVALTRRADLEQFRSFLRSLLMHAAVGTALGGVCTLVGEPQNLLIAGKMGWDFVEFFVRMAPVTLPVLALGLCTCVAMERLRWFGYGATLPDGVRDVLVSYAQHNEQRRTREESVRLVVQGIAAVLLIAGLALHVAEVGLLGLAIIVIQTAFNGVIDEHRIGRAFVEALPFTALLVVFFVVVGVIHTQHLFTPVIEWVLALEPAAQPPMFYIANGLLSAISDNVFVATVYINEVSQAYAAGEFEQPHYDALAVAINTGTNIASVATPNGQAAFLFLLTSSIAPLVRLSYLRMVVMALPYTIVMGVMGYIGVRFFL
ncbi:MAG: sodium/proton antiporter NhaB, partial [Gammaproteobacteria bacterium]|nr:sodium/proton antiporter NhaB [Gammaproteobacteria bacterium]